MSRFAPGHVLVCLALLVPAVGAPAWSQPEPSDPSAPEVTVTPVQPLIGTALLHPRYSYTATTLPDGRILLVGGVDNDYAISPSVELFDPATGLMTEAAPMPEGRVYHSTTLLSDGRVLVVGGLSGSGTMLSRGASGYYFEGGHAVPELLATAIIYDAPSNSWSPASALDHRVAAHSATLLDDGRVLVAGGLLDAGQLHASDAMALYDPATNTWVAASELHQSRYGHEATRLADGRVVVAGGWAPSDPGYAANGVQSLEIFDPGRGTVGAPIPVPAEASGSLALMTLSDGRVLVTHEGQLWSINSDAPIPVWVFDPASGAVTQREIEVADGISLALPLEDGRIFMVLHATEVVYCPAVEGIVCPPFLEQVTYLVWDPRDGHIEHLSTPTPEEPFSVYGGDGGVVAGPGTVVVFLGGRARVVSI